MAGPCGPDCACDGNGAIKYEETTFDDNGLERNHMFGTRLCPERMKAEPIAGQAAWFSSETVFTEQVETWLGVVSVTVSAEVPISEDNSRVVRRGNRYYGTSINLDMESDVDGHHLEPDSARAIAAMLGRAADAAEAVDKPDQAPCGHWWPCDCSEAAA